MSTNAPPSPQSRALSLAARLVTQAEAEGIEVASVYIYAPPREPGDEDDYMTLTLMPADEEMGAALAFNVGLADRDTVDRTVAHRGRIDGAYVTVQYTAADLAVTP